MIIETPYGEIEYRDKSDREVLKEVIAEDAYRRWGDIKINKGDFVIDCGAHIGSFTKLALFYGAEVIAVEPHPGNYKLLQKNIQTDNAILLNRAVSNEKTVMLTDEFRNDLHRIDESGKIKVSGISLDELIGEQVVDLLKMDIEGTEYDALYTSKKLHMIKQLTMEWHFGATKMSELIIHLEKHNLVTTWLGGNGQWGKLQMKNILAMELGKF